MGDLARLAQRTSREELEARFGPAVLVGSAQLAGLFDDDGDEEPAWVYMTRETMPLRESSERPPPPGADSRVYGIVKRGSGAFADTVLVGRASSNDVCVDDPSVSKLHARITRAEDGMLSLHDAGSKNGTFRDGEPVREPVELGDGDRVRLGDRRFTFRRLGVLLDELERGL